MPVQVDETRPTAAGPARCAFCREDVAPGDAQVCDGCGVALHAPCARELGRCPTLGCSSGATAPTTVAPRVAARREARAVLRLDPGLCLAIGAGALIPTVHALLASLDPRVVASAPLLLAEGVIAFLAFALARRWAP